MKAFKLKSDQKMLYTKRFLPPKNAQFFSIILGIVDKELSSRLTDFVR